MRNHSAELPALLCLDQTAYAKLFLPRHTLILALGYGHQYHDFDLFYMDDHRLAD